MKFSFVYVFSIVISYYFTTCTGQLDDEEELWRRTQLTAVVTYENIEALFRELYNRKFSVHRVPSLAPIKSEGVRLLDNLPDSLEIKKQICESIFNSDYFTNIYEKSINPKAPNVGSQLRKEQSDLYEDLFKRTDGRPSIVGDDSSDGHKYKYENAFRLRTISIHGQEEEVFVFSCLVKKAGLSDYKQYFISEEYDMGGQFSRSIAGRFVFGFNDDKQLVVYAVAQESAILFMLKKKLHVEWLYFDKKSSLSIANKVSDAICRLSLGERIRLCAAIFSTQPLKEHYKFVSSRESVRGECATHAISLRNKTVKHLAGRRVFQEWMFPCNPTYKKRERMVFKTFYVSRAYMDDKVFLYRRKRRGKMNLKYYFYNTGITEVRIESQSYSARSDFVRDQVRLEE